MQTLEAQVLDDTHLRLFPPVQLPKRNRVVIAMMQPDDDERGDLAASLAQPTGPRI